MKNMLVVLIAALGVAGCSSTQNTNSSSAGHDSSRTPAQSGGQGQTLEGNDARYMLDIFESAKALDVSKGSCGMGTCYPSGSAFITCQHPNEGGVQSCEIQAAKNPSVKGRVAAAEAQRLFDALEKTNVVRVPDGASTPGSSYTEAKFSMLCRHPSEGNGAGSCKLTTIK